MEKDIERIKKEVEEFIEKYGYTIEVYTSAEGRYSDGKLIYPRVIITVKS